MTLTEMRLESGFKAKKIAEILGISRVQLYNLEKGRYKLDKLKIEKLCEVFRKSKEEILQASKRSDINVGKREAI